MDDQNTPQIGQNSINQHGLSLEKPKVNYWMFSTLILAVALVALSIFTLSQRRDIKSANNPEQKSNLSINSGSQLPDDKTFLVTAIDSHKYRVILYDRNSKQLKEKTIDFASTGLDIGLLGSRFAGVSGTESVHYNSATGEIILVVRSTEGGEGGYKSPRALTEPDFVYAIYRTTFDNKDGLTRLFSSKEQIPNNVILDSSGDALIFTTRTYQNNKIVSEDIFEFDLKDKSARKITSIQTASDGKGIVELSDLSMSSQISRMHQLVLYGAQGLWKDQRLELKTIDLIDGTIETKTVVAGAGVAFSITGLSKDGSKMVFYTIEDNERKLQFKDLDKDMITPISVSEEIKNLNLFISGNKNQILYGTDNGWTLFDIDTKEASKLGLTRPFIWSPSDNYIVGVQGEKFVIYDTQKLTAEDMEIKLNEDEENSIEVAQWK